MALQKSTSELNDSDRKTVRFNDPSKQTDKDVWRKIEDDYEGQKHNVGDYIKQKHEEEVPLTINPVIDFLDKAVFPTLNEGLVDMFIKIKEEDSFYHRKSTLIGLDHLAEYLWNMNPKYPERQKNWTYIFDMDWVKEFLKEHPRPFYPFHLIWNKNFATLKMQSYMRGYWVRRRDDVQEMRQFWKKIKEENWRGYFGNN